MAWYGEPGRHDLSRRGIQSSRKGIRSSIPKDIYEAHKKRLNSEPGDPEDYPEEERYNEKVESLARELMEDGSLPFIEEDSIIVVRSDPSFHVFDRKNRKVNEIMFFDDDPKNMTFVGEKEGVKFATEPNVINRNYIYPHEYEERYKKYVIGE
jgi:hypothetical protein